MNTIGEHNMTQSQQTGPKKAVITGGGTGIGRPAALALAAEGYEVAVAGRTAATLEQTVTLVTHAGGSAQYVIADVHDEAAVPGYSGYVASKHAEIGLTKSAALDYADRGVRVNAVCPGLVNTPLIADMFENPTMHQQLVASHPLGRIAEPQEVADAIVWLATNRSSYVTGVALPVDGGYLAR
jgi:NAD(P)-dependent dehydrogenase (short-subunit alcohol dehydrogenase family)